MFLREIFEGVTTVFSRSGNKMVRKYRCTTGSRKGRIVAKPSTCTAPRNVGQSQAMKKSRRGKQSTTAVKSKRTKRTNPISRRLRGLNRGRMIRPHRRAYKRRSR